MLPDVLYYYRMRPMSITHTRDGRLNQWLEATWPLVELAKEKYPQYLDLAWGRYNIIQLRSLDAIFECDRFRKHPCWKFQYRLLRKRLGSLLFQRCPQVRPMRRAYALRRFCAPIWWPPMCAAAAAATAASSLMNTRRAMPHG